MKTKVKLYLALLLVGFLSAAVVTFVGEGVIAQGESQEEDSHSHEEEQAEQPEAEQPIPPVEGDPEEEQATPEEADSEDEQSADQPGKYVYTTQPGDSYTLMARKAVQTYGKKFDVQVNPAGIIFAETNLTLAAGSPMLEVGQEVSVDEALVKDWVDRAQALSDEKEAAWEFYVQFADFNTDSVGEAG